MDGLHSNTKYCLSVCIKLSTFEKSRLFILFYSTLSVALSLSLSRQGGLRQRDLVIL